MRHWTRKTVTPDYYAMAVFNGNIDRSRKPTGRIEDARAKNRATLEKKDGTPKHFAQIIDTVRGDMKSELQAYPVQVASKATAYCIGNADKLDMLLNPDMGLLTHIGKRARLGQGKILSVSITPDETATELWKQRILPWQEDGFITINANVKPPYWDAKERQVAWAHPSVF